MLSYEFAAVMNGYKPNTRQVNTSTHYLSISNVVVPSEVDWRKEGYVTPVKDQGRFVSIERPFAKHLLSCYIPSTSNQNN